MMSVALTIRMTARAVTVTLTVYSLILGGNLVVLVVLIRRLGGDLASPGPGALTALELFVSLIALAFILIMIHALAAVAMMRVTANDEEVRVPRPYGARHVERAALAAIRLGRLPQPLAGGTEVYRFIRHDGSEAFHIQKAVFLPADVSALANYLNVPLEGVSASS